MSAHDTHTPSDGADGRDQELRERLRALEHLHASGTISAAQLEEERRRAIAESRAAGPATAAPPTAPLAARPPDPAPPPGPPPAGPGRGRGRPGMPRWALAVAVAAVVAGGAAAGIVVAVRGGDGPATAAAGPTAEQAYAAAVRGPLDRLTASAVATGTALARTSEPAEIPRLGRAVDRQIGVVEEARRRLASVSVGAGQRGAHAALVGAAAEQRRHLVLLGRAASGTPDRSKLQAAAGARRAAGAAIRGYRTFFSLVPSAPDAITGTGLADTGGLQAALRAAIEPPDRPPPPPPPDGVVRSQAFQSPTGNLRCQVSAGTLFCSSSNDGFGVALPGDGEPSTGTGIASGGPVVPYGRTWRNGAFSCESAVDGITCRNASGNGFFLNRDEYRPF